MLRVAMVRPAVMPTAQVRTVKRCLIWSSMGGASGGAVPAQDRFGGALPDLVQKVVAGILGAAWQGLEGQGQVVVVLVVHGGEFSGGETFGVVGAELVHGGLLWDLWDCVEGRSLARRRRAVQGGLQIGGEGLQPKDQLLR